MSGLALLLAVWTSSAAAQAPAAPAPRTPDVLAWAARAAEARRVVQSDLARRAPAARVTAYREGWARYEASRSVPAAVPAAPPAPLAAALVAAHLFVPAGSENLVSRQAVIVERRFGTVGRRGARYFPMIERALRRRGLPADLKYVAVVESALNPNAVSSAGAAGLWQFMPATAADLGLDSLGIRDPARATEAAVRYLERLGRAFGGDWQLALAAYNCGPGRVGRLVAAHRARTGRAPTFWDLHAALPAETRDYVPRFIAVAQHFGAERVTV